MAEQEPCTGQEGGHRAVTLREAQIPTHFDEDGAWYTLFDLPGFPGYLVDGAQAFRGQRCIAFRLGAGHRFQVRPHLFCVRVRPKPTGADLAQGKRRPAITAFYLPDGSQLREVVTNCQNIAVSEVHDLLRAWDAVKVHLHPGRATEGEIGRDAYLTTWRTVRPHYKTKGLVAALATKFGVDVSTIRNWKKKYGYPIYEPISDFPEPE